MLDPSDWDAFRTQAQEMLERTIDDIQTVAQRPAWQSVPVEIRNELQNLPLPMSGRSLAEVHARFERMVAPYTVGNRHPRFMGWVHGSGSPSGMLAQMLMAGLNINAGGREHAGVYLERRLVAWWAEIFGFPAYSSGIVTSGTSVATLLAVQTARTRALGVEVREHGLRNARLVGYAAAGTHHCVRKAFEISGLGRAALRAIAVTPSGGLDVSALALQIAQDRAAGDTPFMLIGTVGMVDSAASDDLHALADFAAAQNLWFHVDGAFGALAILAPARRRIVAGIERADSLAVDFHKWLHAPYGTGLMLTRHAQWHRATFADDVPYLARLDAGTAGGQPWFCDYGIELSRSFSALGVWLTMEEFGLERLGAAIEDNCRLATNLGAALLAIPHMQLAAPVKLNIVCVRYAPPGYSTAQSDERNAALVIDLQTRGIAVPSTTRINGYLVMRFNITNHRTRDADIPVIVTALRTLIEGDSEGAYPAPA